MSFCLFFFYCDGEPPDLPSFPTRRSSDLWHDGSDPQRMHNYYAQLFNACVFELLEKERGTGQAVVFARSATAGGQQYPVHWGGDCESTFSAMSESLRGGLCLRSEERRVGEECGSVGGAWWWRE